MENIISPLVPNQDAAKLFKYIKHPLTDCYWFCHELMGIDSVISSVGASVTVWLHLGPYIQYWRGKWNYNCKKKKKKLYVCKKGKKKPSTFLKLSPRVS